MSVCSEPHSCGLGVLLFFSFIRAGGGVRVDRWVLNVRYRLLA